jgi:hypothetical protein
MSGHELIDTVVAATGLPEDFAKTELYSLLAQKNLAAETLSLEELREVLADLLQSLILE